MSYSDQDLRDLLMTATRRLRRGWMAALRPWDLSPHEHRALRTIADSDTPLRLGEIARALRIAPRSATEVVDRLETRGWTRRVPDPRDRRAVGVELTDAGRSLTADLAAERDAHAATLFHALDPAERDRLGDLLTALRDRTSDPSDDCPDPTRERRR